VIQSTLDATLQRVFSPTQLLILRQFLRFAVVGVIGFAVDTGTVYGLRNYVGLYAAGMIAYMTAASANWLLNRLWTFKGQGSGPAHHQWAKYMVANLTGFILNRGTYIILIATVPMAVRQPVIATAAGAIAGMFINFSLSRRVVFR
jgi:putative flippase GtrA